MNIKELHTKEKTVSAISIFKSALASATAIQILPGGKLKEHISKAPAFLICIEGKVVFENEKGLKEILSPGDYINIEANVKHWIDGIIDSYLLLVK